MIQPSCCLMIPYTVDNPSPVPLPSFFVVKNGSKILCRVASSIPAPLSEIDTTTKSPCRAYGYCRQYSSPMRAFPAISRILKPPSGMPGSGIPSRRSMIASLAFTHRFIITWCIWFGSAEASQRSAAETVSTPIRLSMVCENRSATSRATFPRSRALRSDGERREKSRSCRTMLAARSEARIDSLTGIDAREVGGMAFWARSRLPRIPVRMLLKSWATPPARVPTASIFCISMICLSRRVLSVMSRRMIIPRGPVSLGIHVAFPLSLGSQLAEISPVKDDPSRRRIPASDSYLPPASPPDRRNSRSAGSRSGSSRIIAGSRPKRSSVSGNPSIAAAAGLARTIFPPRTRITPSRWLFRRSSYPPFAQTKNSWRLALWMATPILWARAETDSSSTRSNADRLSA